LIAGRDHGILCPGQAVECRKVELKGESQMKRVLGLLLALCVMFALTSVPSFSQPQDKKEEKGEKKKGEGKKGEKGEKGEKKKGEGKKKDESK
jgi:hypothetical protein